MVVEGEVGKKIGLTRCRLCRNAERWVSRAGNHRQVRVRLRGLAFAALRSGVLVVLGVLGGPAAPGGTSIRWGLAVSSLERGRGSWVPRAMTLQGCYSGVKPPMRGMAHAIHVYQPHLSLSPSCSLLVRYPRVSRVST